MLWFPILCLTYALLYNIESTKMNSTFVFVLQCYLLYAKGVWYGMDYFAESI